jgi:hypothetical protein
MKDNPQEFQPMKFRFPEPISYVQRYIARSTPDRLLCLSMPASALVPTTNIPNTRLFLYARGDELLKLVDGLKSSLTKALLEKL